MKPFLSSLSEIEERLASAQYSGLIRLKQISEKRQFIEERISEVTRALKNAELNLKEFKESNRRVERSPSLKLDESRLEREVSLQTTLYMTLKSQFENVKIEEKIKTSDDGKGILITNDAIEQISSLLKNQTDKKVLRVGVRSGGCSGMSYTMDFIGGDEINADDKVYDYSLSAEQTFKVICDPKSLLYIYGMQLDFSKDLIGGGFNFVNPNASQTCGCGSSFAV